MAGAKHAEEHDEIVFPVEEEEPEINEWIVSFADMITLLFALFVLLYTLSTPDVKKMSETFASVTKALGGKMDQSLTSKITQEEAGVLIDQALMRRQLIETQRKVFAEVKTLQSTKGMEGVVTASFEDGIITLRAPGDVVFSRGQVELSAQGKEIIAAFKNFFIQHPDLTINILGYTDDIAPQSGVRFKDNWELSALRAVYVLRELLAMGIEPNRLTATGLADLKPIVPNNTEENRAKNRRVEFVLEKRMTGAR
jgi:chemotaxis protein MotB